MKKILIILFIFSYSNHLIAQIMVGEPYYFCALNGSCYNDNDRRVTIEDNEYTHEEIIHLTEQFQNAHPEFEIIEPTSMRYNCHGYAYSVFQGGEKLWIQWEEDICNDNGTEYYSYVIIPENEAKYGDIATIIDTTVDNYSPHSCIVYNNDTLISKFAYTPLFKHHKHDPWITQETGINSSSVYTYYRRVANTQINGSDTFNGNGTYTFAPNVEIESCTWSVEPVAMFQQSSGSGTIANLSYKSNLSYLAPKAVLTFTFGYSCDNHYTVKKEIDLTLPTSTLSGIIESDGFVIADGATVTVTGEIRTNENAKTIVKPGGKLIVDGGTITKALHEGQWQGIEVWGVDTLHQFIVDGRYQQGYLELKNGATIENAICAVELWQPGNYSSEGGIIHATDAVFRNNAKAVHAINYTNYVPTNGNSSSYNSWFKNCEFIVDSDYISDETFYKHIDLDRVNGIGFEGCSFSVDRNVENVSQWCSGLAVYNAGFAVNSYCSDNTIQPCLDEYLTKSSFSGFHSGIYVRGGSTSYTYNVRNAEFTNNDRGIYAENTGYGTILFNDFIVGTDADCSFGIYMNETTGFCIEENNFIGDEKSSSYNYGIGIHNSASANNIYRNTFQSLDCGNVAVGVNITGKTSSMSKQGGLTYACNTNISNINDFCVVRENSSGDIAQSQGSSTLPAGNTFSGSQYHFYNDGESVINYYYNTNNANQTPNSSRLFRITSIPTSSVNPCNPHYGNGSVVRSDEELEELETIYDNSILTFNELNNVYTSRIDGGDTQAELLDINTATADDASRLRSQLLGLSPYLSQEVLTTAASRNDVFSTSTLFEILSANPDELKKDTLISYLENKDNPMPEYMTELLREIANGSTARTALESQMAKSEREYILAAGDIVRSNLNSEESDNEELRLWLGNMNDMASDRLAIATYIQEGDFENALALAETLPDVYGLQGTELEEHNDYISILRLYETLDESGRDIMQLTETETEMLEEIADNGSGSSQMMATAIIEQNGVTTGTGYSCPTLPTANNSKRGTANLKSDIASAMGMKADFAPNPATAWTEIDYTLPLDEEKASLVITNALGVNVMTTELDGNQGRKTLYLEQLPAGVYTYFVKCGEYTITGKLMKK